MKFKYKLKQFFMNWRLYNINKRDIKRTNNYHKEIVHLNKYDILYTLLNFVLSIFITAIIIIIFVFIIRMVTN